MSRLSSLLLVSIVLALLAGFGCYTMVRHPCPDDVSFNDSGSGASNCLDCHAGADYDHWTDPYYTEFYNFTPSTWGSYYAHPWWYDEYWYRVPGGHRDSTIVGGRHGWDRGQPQPYVPPLQGGIIVTSGSRGNANVEPDTSKANSQDRQKEQEKEQDQQRHAWGR